MDPSLPLVHIFPLISLCWALGRSFLEETWVRILCGRRLYLQPAGLSWKQIGWGGGLIELSCPGVGDRNGGSILGDLVSLHLSPLLSPMGASSSARGADKRVPSSIRSLSFQVHVSLHLVDPDWMLVQPWMKSSSCGFWFTGGPDPSPVLPRRGRKEEKIQFHLRHDMDWVGEKWWLPRGNTQGLLLGEGWIERWQKVLRSTLESDWSLFFFFFVVKKYLLEFC